MNGMFCSNFTSNMFERSAFQEILLERIYIGWWMLKMTVWHLNGSWCILDHECQLSVIETDPFFLNAGSQPLISFYWKDVWYHMVSVWSLLFIEKCHRSHHRFRYNDAPLQMGPMDLDSSAVVIFAALQPCMDLEAIKSDKMRKIDVDMWFWCTKILLCWG